MRLIYNFFCVCLIMGYLSVCHGQTVEVKGTIKSLRSDTGIPDALISIANTSGAGTTSKKDGSFEIQIPQEYLSRYFYISGFGAHDTLIEIKYFLSGNKILRVQDWQIDLEEVVVVKNLYCSTYWYGDTNRMIQQYTETPYIFDNGSYLGLYVKNHREGLLNSLYININDDKYYHSKLGLRIKKIDQDLKADRTYFYDDYPDLLPDLLIIQADAPGMLKIDLSGYDLLVKSSENLVIALFPIDNRERPIVKKNNSLYTVLQGKRDNDNFYPGIVAYNKKVKNINSMRVVHGKISFSEENELRPPMLAVEMKIK